MIQSVQDELCCWVRNGDTLVYVNTRLGVSIQSENARGKFDPDTAREIADALIEAADAYATLHSHLRAIKEMVTLLNTDELTSESAE